MVVKNKITKEKIALHLKEKLGLSSELCNKVVDNFFHEILAIVQKNHKLILLNFGRFFLHHKKARPVRDMQQNQSIMLEERNILSFSPAKQLKKRVKDNATK